METTDFFRCRIDAMLNLRERERERDSVEAQPGCAQRLKIKALNLG